MTEALHNKTLTQHQTTHGLTGWTAVSGAVPGRKHILEGVPCQDACIAEASPRPYVLACDGKGSSPRSQLGAAATVTEVSHAISCSAALLSALLDTADPDAEEKIFPLVTDFLQRTMAMGVDRTARINGVEARDLEHTAALAVMGKHRFLVMHVGDAGIAAEYNGGPVLLTSEDQGEFANTTTFVNGDHAPDTWYAALVPADGIDGLAAFTDGTAGQMLEMGTNRPAFGFSQMWHRMRHGEFGRRDVLAFLADRQWEPAVQDDRSLALLSRTASASATMRSEDTDTEQYVMAERPPAEEQVEDEAPNTGGAVEGVEHPPTVSETAAPQTVGRHHYWYKRLRRITPMVMLGNLALTSLCLGLLLAVWQLLPVQSSPTVDQSAQDKRTINREETNPGRATSEVSTEEGSEINQTPYPLLFPSMDAGDRLSELWFGQRKLFYLQKERRKEPDVKEREDETAQTTSQRNR